MKKVPWWVALLTLILGIGGTIIAIFWHKVFPKGTDLDLTALITFIGIVLGLIGVLWSTNKQIRNQNKQNQRPYIIITDINTIPLNHEVKNLEESRTSYKIECDNYYNMMSSLGKQNVKIPFKYTTNNKFVYIVFENIGFGVAHNIVLYNISNESKVLRESPYATDGEMGSTFDIKPNEKINKKTNLFNKPNKEKKKMIL